MSVIKTDEIMESVYWPRLIETVLEDVQKTFPVTVITGPRQSGKSTLLNVFLKRKHATVINLDDPEFRALLREDPISYLEQVPKPVLIDEIQQMPELASYIKILVDRDRTPGNWYITGSQQFSVMKHMAESLAGRAAVLSLPTFQLQERKNVNSLEYFLLGSTYPEPAVNTTVRTDIWYSSYLQTYLERDVRSIMNIVDLRDFEQLLRLLAARTSQVLNYSHLSNAIGISVPTVKRWISVLEASYIILLVPPFFKNLGKRIIKAPKLYFYDIGLVNYLIGINDINILLKGPLAGPLFETAIVSEMYKRKLGSGIKPELYHWRSQSGIEVDLITSEEGSYVPHEIKLSANIKPAFYKNLQYWLKLNETGQEKGKGTGHLITNCKSSLPLPKSIRNIYWQDI